MIFFGVYVKWSRAIWNGANLFPNNSTKHVTHLMKQKTSTPLILTVFQDLIRKQLRKEILKAD
jgi:hypothetical protein